MAHGTSRRTPYHSRSGRDIYPHTYLRTHTTPFPTGTGDCTLSALYLEPHYLLSHIISPFDPHYFTTKRPCAPISVSTFHLLPFASTTCIRHTTTPILQPVILFPMAGPDRVSLCVERASVHIPHVVSTCVQSPVHRVAQPPHPAHGLLGRHSGGQGGGASGFYPALACCCCGGGSRSGGGRIGSRSGPSRVD